VNVLVLTHYYPPEIGAAQRRLGALVSRWQASGASVRVVAPVPHYPTGHAAAGGWRSVYRSGGGPFGETLVHVPFLPTGRGGAVKFLDQVVAAGCALPPSVAGTRPDVVLASLPGLPTILPALAARRRWRVPLVLEMRDAWPDLVAESGVARGVLGRSLMRTVSRAQHAADAVVTVTRDFGEVLAARGIPRSRLHWMPNGIDVASVPRLPAVPGDAARPLRVLYLGTHGVSQQLTTAVEALAALGAARVEARFVGHGTEKPALEALARSLDAPVHFEPPATGVALWDAYRWADTCLVPLRPWPSFRHTVPSKLYEIMAAGRHVTACVAGEAARIVSAAGGGAVVAPGDAAALAASLASLAADRAPLLVGEGPRRWVEENGSYDTIAARYLSLLERMAGRAAGVGVAAA
jgi:glycosyltransferase involved in cell wall biosynthesis